MRLHLSVRETAEGRLEVFEVVDSATTVGRSDDLLRVQSELFCDVSPCGLDL
jgi:hypothetical protein